MGEKAGVDELLQAAQIAPKFGLNARALILTAAQASDSDEEQTAEAARAPKRQRRDPAALAAAAAVKHGADFLAAVDVKQRPLVAYLAHSKIPRINRQTVLNKMAGQHLVLAALRRRPPLRAQAAAADAEIRQEAFEAAMAQELELYGRCGSTVVYQNLAARTSAAQWQAAQLALAYAPMGQAQQQTPVQGQEQQEKRQLQLHDQQQQQQQQQQQKEQQRQANAKPRRRPASKKAAPAVPLEEAELDWAAVLPYTDGDVAAAEEGAGITEGG